MKKRHLVYAIALIVGMGACAASAKKQAEAKPDVWKSYNVGTVLFEDKASETKGSDIYHRIIPDAESYIKEQARTVLATLYNSPEDSITPVNKIHYTLEDIEGISAKGGGNGDVTIFYSTRHIEKSFAENDTAKHVLRNAWGTVARTDTRLSAGTARHRLLRNQSCILGIY